jgi:hypothetical protein
MSRIDGAGNVDLLARYVDAFERYNMDALVSVLHEDATSASGSTFTVSVRSGRASRSGRTPLAPGMP